MDQRLSGLLGLSELDIMMEELRGAPVGRSSLDPNRPFGEGDYFGTPSPDPRPAMQASIDEAAPALRAAMLVPLIGAVGSGRGTGPGNAHRANLRRLGIDPDSPDAPAMPVAPQRVRIPSQREQIRQANGGVLPPTSRYLPSAQQQARERGVITDGRRQIPSAESQYQQYGPPRPEPYGPIIPDAPVQPGRPEAPFPRETSLDHDYNNYLADYVPPPRLTPEQQSRLGVDPQRVADRIALSQQYRPQPTHDDAQVDWVTRMTAQPGFPNPRDPQHMRQLSEYQRWYEAQRDAILPGVHQREQVEIDARRAAAAVPAVRGTRVHTETMPLRNAMLDAQMSGDRQATQRAIDALQAEVARLRAIYGGDN